MNSEKGMKRIVSIPTMYGKLLMILKTAITLILTIGNDSNNLVIIKEICLLQHIFICIK